MKRRLSDLGGALGLTALLPSRGGSAGDGWSRVRTEPDGIALESRTVADSGLPELRVTVSSALAPLSLLESAWALRSGGVQAKYLAERRVLSASATDRELFLRYEPPMIGARQCVLRQERTSDGESGAASISFAQLQRPAQTGGGAAPFAHLRGSWRFEPLGVGTRVVYTVLVDLGGVPAFLARGAQEDAAVETVREVVARATP